MARRTVILGYVDGDAAVALQVADDLERDGWHVIHHRNGVSWVGSGHISAWLTVSDYYLLLCSPLVRKSTLIKHFDTVVKVQRVRRRPRIVVGLLPQGSIPEAALRAPVVDFRESYGQGLLALDRLLRPQPGGLRRAAGWAVAGVLLLALGVAGGIAWQVGGLGGNRARQDTPLAIDQLVSAFPRPLQQPITDPLDTLMPLPSGVMRSPWQGIVVHHSESHDAPVNEIRRWHLERGWNDVGYHFIIHKDGAIELGRGLQYVGAHARERNPTHLAICVTGDFDGGTQSRTAHRRPTTRQLDSLVQLTSSMVSLFNIPLSRIEMHHEHCPGSRFPWEAFIGRVAEAQAEIGPSTLVNELRAAGMPAGDGQLVR